MSRSFFVGLACLFLSLALGQTRVSAQTNVELLIDDSGSMAQRIEGQSKISIAKQVLSGLVQDLPGDAQIAVRTYGRAKPSSARDCSDMELLTPFGPNSGPRVLPAVQSLKPNGMTPIAASLKAAATDFAGKEGQNNIVILLSDGEEDCNGDPCTAAKTLHDAGIQLQINVIGFHVKPNERRQLQCVASAGGGKYYDAADARELKVAASEVKAKIAAAEPTATATPYVKSGEPLSGEPIRGGDSYDGAKPLPAGKLFHLDHDEPGGQHDFFTVQAHSGQAIVVTVHSGAGGYANAQIFDPNHESVASAGELIAAKQTAEARRDVADQQDGTYFVLIGSKYGVEKQDVTFRLDLISAGDADTDRDAGANETRAMEIKPGTYLHNHLSESDTIDVFKFQAEADKTYQFKVRGKSDATLHLTSVDADGVELGDADAPNDGAVTKLENLKITKSGPIYVRVFVKYGKQVLRPYTFAVGSGDIDSPPAPQE